MTEIPDPLRDRLRDRLGAADPARSVAPPPDRWIAELTEAVMSTSINPGTDTHAAPTRRRSWLVPAAAAAVLAAVGVGAVVLGPGGGDGGPVAAPSATSPRAQSTPHSTPPVVDLRAGAVQAGRCLPVSAEALQRMPTALEGIVTRVSGTNATLRVTRWWRAVDDQQRAAETVSVRGMSRELQQLVAGVDLEEGGRYLVTATEDGDVTACGFSAAFSPRLEQLYAEAYGG